MLDLTQIILLACVIAFSIFLAIMVRRQYMDKKKCKQEIQDIANEILDLAENLKEETGGVMSLSKIRWELRRNHSLKKIISEIQRVRPKGDKSGLRKGFRTIPGYNTCERCGWVSDDLVQCPYCGKWVGRIEGALYNRRYSDCWSFSMSCCADCRKFIMQRLREITASSVDAALQMLLERWAEKYIWKIDTSVPIFSFSPRHITLDEKKALDSAALQEGSLTREELMRSPLNWDLSRAERVLGELEKAGIATRKVVEGAYVWEFPGLIVREEK